MTRRLALGVALGCALAAAATAGERVATSYVPADCWLAICYDGAHPGVRETPLHQFLQEPGVKAVLTQAQPLLEKLYGSMDQEAGFPLSPALRAAFRCDLAVAVGGPRAKKSDEAAYVMAVRVGGEEAPARRAFKSLMDQTRETAKAGSVKELTVGQLKATSLTDKEGDPHCFVFDGEFLVDSNSEAMFRRALGAETPKLAERLGDERALLRIRYDHQTMVKLFGGEIDEQGKRFLAAAGLDTVERAEWLLVPRGKRLAAELRIDMPKAAEGSRLAKWFADAPRYDPELLRRVPGDASLFALSSMDVLGLWDAVWEIVEKTDPEAGRAAREALTALERKAGVQVRDGVLRPLGRGTAVVARGTGLLNGTDLVLVQRVADGKALEASIAQLVNRLDILLMGLGQDVGPIRTGLRTFQYRGYTARYVWLMGTPALMLGGWAPCYANLGDVFVFAKHPLDLKAYLDFLVDKRPSIVDNREFQALRQLVPEGATSISYGEWGDALVAMYNTLAPVLTILQGFREELEMEQAVDLANLPPSRLLRRYTGGSVAYSVFRDGRYRVEAQANGVGFLSPHVAPLGGAGVLGAILLPATARARSEARLIRDRNNLNQIAKGCATYLNEHGDNRRYPASLAELFDKGVIPDKGVFVSPFDNDPPKLPNGLPCSYVSVFERYPKRQFLDDFPPNVPMAWDRKPFAKGGRNLLFFDSHVEFVEEAGFQEILRRLDEQVKKFAKERKPATEF